MPMRGDEVAEWIKRHRDEYLDIREYSLAWIAIDELLNDYRLHADVGRPLSEDVTEGNELHDT